MSNVVGAQLPTESAEFRSQVDGLGPDKIVTVHNPLTQDFRVQYSRPLVGNPTLSPGAQLARDRAGLDLSKTSGVQGHAVQYHVMKAGSTENLPGDIAQIAVRQLRNHILMARAGKGNIKKIADPVAQMEAEAEIVQKVTDSTAFYNRDENPAPGTGQTYEPTASTKASK